MLKIIFLNENIVFLCVVEFFICKDSGKYFSIYVDLEKCLYSFFGKVIGSCILVI